MSAARPIHVVVVNPGDVLIIGNIGDIDPEVANEIIAAMNPLKDLLQLSGVMIFEADIDLAAVSDGRSA